MTLLLLILLLLRTGTISCENSGSTLFYNKNPKECWSDEDIAKLRARKLFEQLIPENITPDRVNAKFIKSSITYFRKALRDVDKNVEPQSARVLKEVLADTMGGHLRSEILPAVRFAYYAGFVSYRKARQLHDFLEELKTLLNTKGLGWRKPSNTLQFSNLTVFKIMLTPANIRDSCACLIMKRDVNSCIHLPKPILDDKYEPSALAVPFRTGSLVSLTALKSDNKLLKYYISASRCILQKSPKHCRHTDYVSFNEELWHWMKREIAPHLNDEKLYAAFGGILRVAAAVQNYGKGLTRRNLFDYHNAPSTNWNPWKKLTQSYVEVDVDWSPKYYVGLVILAAFVIYMLQILYNYIFESNLDCHCKKESSISDKEELSQVNYAKVDTNFPAMLPPQQSPVYYNECKKSSSKYTPSQTLSKKQEKVDDLKENNEQTGAMDFSNDETSQSESTSSPSSKESDRSENKSVEKRPRSPPKIETTVAHVHIDKKKPPSIQNELPKYSTSTMSRTECASEEQLSETEWSESGSCTSAHSRTSCSKTQSEKSRDLAWARKVISKTTRSHRKSASDATEIDLSSFTTPPSRR